MGSLGGSRSSVSYFKQGLLRAGLSLVIKPFQQKRLQRFSGKTRKDCGLISSKRVHVEIAVNGCKLKYQVSDVCGHCHMEAEFMKCFVVVGRLMEKGYRF